MADLTQRAIGEALKQNWEKAIEINREILVEKPDDTEALNRLAFALAEHGEVKEARTIYEKVLTINRFNQIALKNLKRLSILRGGKPTNGKSMQVAKSTNLGNLFLEEIGKTKVVTLINVAEAKILSGLHATNQVLLVPRRRGISVVGSDNTTYLGALPDDVARRLYMLMKGGNQYEAYVKSVNRNEVSIFIRETLRDAKFRNQASFLGRSSSNYLLSVRDEARVEEPVDVSSLEDDLEKDADDILDDGEES